MSESKYQATSSDGKEILRILESSAASGSIELIYTRRPDAYESYMKEPGEARVFISRDGVRAVGTCAQLISDVYVGGEACRASYVCGLKKDAQYEGGIGFGPDFIRSLSLCDADIFYCSVVADNKEAQRIFKSGRRLIEMKPFSEYRTFILSPRVKIKGRINGDLSFLRASTEDEDELLSFLSREGRKKDLFPVVDSFDKFHGLSVGDFYLLRDGGRIVSAAALWDRTDCKQYVVKKYRGIMRLARVLDPLLSLLGYIRLPKEDEPLRFPMLSFFLAENDCEEYYITLLSHILKASKEKHEILVIGLPKEHFAYRIYERLPSIHFDTVFFSVSFPFCDKKSKETDPKALYPECAVL